MGDSKDSKAFLTGFVLGGLVGAAAALFMTPQSGEQARVLLQQKGSELKSQYVDKTPAIDDSDESVVEEIATEEAKVPTDE
jgi:gas vesicle protein